MTQDERTRTGDGQHGRTGRTGDLGRTRRSFLASSLAGGALVSGGGVVAGQSTVVPTDVGGPAAPTGLEATVPATTSGVELSWDGVADSCTNPLYSYVVTRNGERVASTPAGVTRARLTPESDERAEYGVYAIDESDLTSPSVTVQAVPGVSDPPTIVSVEPARETVAVGDTVTADLVARPGTSSLSEFVAYDLTVSLSTPCAAMIRDASVDDAFTPNFEPRIRAEGSSVELSGNEFDGDYDGVVTLASLELVGLRPGGTALDVSLNGDDETPLILSGVSGWSSLTVEEGERPRPPLNVSTSGGFEDATVSWTGFADPCSAPVDHYVVSVNGSDVRTIPAGLTRTTVGPSEGEYTVGVRAVADDGTESATVTATGEMSSGVSDPLVFFTASSQPGTVAPGETASVDLEIRPGPFTDSASIGETEVSVSTPCAVDLTDVRFPDGAPDGATATIADDGSSATLSPGDGRFTDSFATVEVTGRAAAGTEIRVRGPVTTTSVDAETMGTRTTVTVSEAAAGPPAVGDNDARPRDPDDDGLYEDVNGNGEQEMADVVDFFQHRDSDAVRENVDAYDFSGNDEIDLGDAVQLFTENAG